MGYDLKPMRPNANYPRNEKGKPVWGRYNMRGWYMLHRGFYYAGRPKLILPQTNQGDLILAKTCREVADLMEKHPEHFSEFPSSDILEWRNSGGFRVY